MREKGKAFWCASWEQYVYESVCIHRVKKGLKKCSGCPKGHELVAAAVAQLVEEQKQIKPAAQPQPIDEV